MATVEIIPRVPPESILPPFESATEFILNRQRGEFITPLTQYGYFSNQQLVIDINSPTSFVDFSNSYLRFYLQVQGLVKLNTTTITNGNLTLPDMKQYLAEGGVQALFRNITVSTLNGTELSRLPLANRLQAWFRNVTKSREYIDRTMWREFDSYEPLMEMERICTYNWQGLPSATATTATGSTFNQAVQDWGTITIALPTTANFYGCISLTFTNVTTANAYAWRDIQLGDEIAISSGTEQDATHQISFLGSVIAFATNDSDGSTAGGIMLRVQSMFTGNNLYVTGSEAVPVFATTMNSFQVFRYKYKWPMRNYVCVATNGALGRYYARNVYNASGQTLDNVGTGNIAKFPGVPVFLPASIYTQANAASGSSDPGSIQFVTNRVLGGLECCVQPFHPILMSTIWWPLFLIRGGLRITLDLERPDYVFVTGNMGVISGWNYTINNPVFVADMIQPTQTLTNMYVDLYADNKLNYHMVGFVQQTDSQASAPAGSFSTRLFPSVRSAIYYIAAIQDNRHWNTVGVVASGGTPYDPGFDPAYVDSLAAGMINYCSTFQIDIGTERFPLNRPLQIDDGNDAYSFGTMAEMYLQMEYCLNTLGKSNAGKCISKDTFTGLVQKGEALWAPMQSGISGMAAGLYTYNTAAATTNYAGPSSYYAGIRDALRFYFCVPLFRHSSPFCGINVKDNAVQPNFVFSAAALQYAWGTNTTQPTTFAAWVSAASTRYIVQFIAYDSAISIGREGLIQRR